MNCLKRRVIDTVWMNPVQIGAIVYGSQLCRKKRVIWRSISSKIQTFVSCDWIWVTCTDMVMAIFCLNDDYLTFFKPIYLPTLCCISYAGGIEHWMLHIICLLDLFHFFIIHFQRLLRAYFRTCIFKCSKKSISRSRRSKWRVLNELMVLSRVILVYLGRITSKNKFSFLVLSPSLNSIQSLKRRLWIFRRRSLLDVKISIQPTMGTLF